MHPNIIIVILIITLTSCRPTPPEQPAQTSPTPAWTQELKQGDWTVYTHGSIAKQIRYKGVSVYTYFCGNVDYKAMYGSDRVTEYDNSVHILASSDLANRMPATDDRHVDNPSPFTDINGDGFPELIFMEDLFICNAYNWYKLTIVTLKPDKATVTGEICAQGEIRYLADYDRDGAAEFITTDGEYNFTFDEKGLPISPYVFSYDKDKGRYESGAEKILVDKCIAELRDLIIKDKLYPWTTIDKIGFHGSIDEDCVDITINEIHRGDDGADPNTQPTIDFFRRKGNGAWSVMWPAPGEGWLSYDRWLMEKKH